MTSLAAFAAARAADRITLTGLLGLRALPYVAEGVAPVGPPIAGLVVEAMGHAERPGWHASTGLHGFVALPPGPCRLLVTDPQRRFLAAAFAAVVPDRSAIRRGIEAGLTVPPTTPRPLLRDVALHPAPGGPIPRGHTAAWGIVTAAGRPVPLARLALATLVGGALRTLVTWSAADGSYLLLLPGERPDLIGGAAPWPAERVLTLHAPNPALAAALAADPLAALPAEADAIDPEAVAAPFARRGFSLRAADGAPREGDAGADPTLPLQGGRSLRWDIELV